MVILENGLHHAFNKQHEAWDCQGHVYDHTHRAETQPHLHTWLGAEQ